MAGSKKKEFDLGRDGTITCHLSDDAKRLLIDSATFCRMPVDR